MSQDESIEQIKSQADTYTRLISILQATRQQYEGIPIQGEYSIAEAIKETLSPEEIEALVNAFRPKAEPVSDGDNW